MYLTIHISKFNNLHLQLVHFRFQWNSKISFLDNSQSFIYNKILSRYHSGCLDPKNILSTIDPPPGCQKITFFFSQMKVFSFSAKITPKRHKLKKTIRIEEKMSKKPCCLRHFQIFFNFGAILARQTSTGMFSGSWRIFWHPWDPWGRVNSRDIWVLRFVLIILWRWRHLADFSLLWKCCPVSAL